ncbi:MAG TPA: CDP-diacylglycerol--glycerol-3-phosphate 3-phosphatidyltransferase [Fimbriiglobus sp.]|jgi:CDP-diacylglycerol--glycerol-3-phosphate 3-phosphatidyltransferase
MGTVPNLLSLSRLPLAAALFVFIANDLWAAALVTFLLAAATDWLDGWWARKFNQGSALGRALDPLTDKVLVCGAFIFLIPVRGAGLEPWMVTVVVARELLVTGIRGMVESAGKKFGADWFGKLKTVLQLAALIAILVEKTVRSTAPEGYSDGPKPVTEILIWAMLVATVGSLIQYTAKAVKALR